MRHPFVDYLVCRNNYFGDPDAVAKLSEGLEYSKSVAYPGKRTDNLLASSNLTVKTFAREFAIRLVHDVFPGIDMHETFIAFHINEESPDPEFNSGWIHNDVGNLAGLVYLTKDESNLDTGTSIFDGETKEEPLDGEARRKFHLTGEITPEYVDGFRRNKNSYTETIRVGNRYNRLVAYDSKLYHRPNSFSTSLGQPRLSLLFFISQFQY